MGDGLRDRLGLEERIAEVELPFGIVGPGPERRLVFADRLREPAGLGEGVRKIDPRLRKIGIESEGGPIGLDGFGISAGIVEGDGQVVADFSGVRFKFGSPPEG